MLSELVSRKDFLGELLDLVQLHFEGTKSTGAPAPLVHKVEHLKLEPADVDGGACEGLIVELRVGDVPVKVGSVARGAVDRKSLHHEYVVELHHR